MSSNQAPNQRSTCIFCGATDQKLSKEHVWPKWLRSFIELGQGPPIEHARTRARRGTTLAREEWSAIPIDWQVKGPCKPCNEGWMERHEREVRPILVPMLQNREVSLKPDAQRVLADWVTLRVLIAQHGHPSGMQIIEPDCYHRFYRTRGLPSGAQLWVGRYDGSGAWPCDYQHLPLWVTRFDGVEPANPNAYVVAMSIGYVALVYIGHDIDQGPVFDCGGAFARQFTSIWPTTGPVNWPPEGLLGADDLDTVVRGFEV